VAVVTVGAVAITAAVATTVGIGAAIAGTAAVASQAISDRVKGEVSDASAYMWAGGRESFIGALSSAVFGPFGTGKNLGGKMLLGGITNGFESIVRRRLENEEITFGNTMFDVGVGALTAWAFHGAGKLFKKAAPFVKNAFNKVSSKISENIKVAKIALKNTIKRPVTVLGFGSGAAGGALGAFTKEFKKVKNARYGEQKVSKSLYDKLRTKTPSDKLQDMVNENIILPMDDPALPGMKIELKEGQKRSLEADHIVSMKKIVCMEGFDQLSFDQQVEVLNYKKNFVGLSKSANTSKGSKYFKDWVLYKKRNIEVDPKFREEMIPKEEKLEGELQELIDKMLKE